LRKAQQSLSRKVKGSHNRKKALARVQKIHVRIANVRRDFLHKVSTAISKNHAVVAIEDLKVGNMSRSAAGTADAPGKNVHTKSGLNKSILDQGWYGFRRMLEYKLSWKGGRLVAVPPQNTSRTCPGCGHVSADNRQTKPGSYAWRAAMRITPTLLARSTSFPAGYNYCGTKGRTRPTLWSGCRWTGCLCQPGWPVDRTA
jgi:IS605 OrfB family transposase